MNTDTKNILLFGDSNTWGFDPACGGRFPYRVRWTTICAEKLGENYNCIPCGMNGRTTIFDDPLKGCRNGLDALDFELQTNKPLDLLVIMLGTNDLKYTDAAGSAEGLKKIIEKAVTANERFSLSYPVFSNGAKILLISPVLITDNLMWGFSNGIEESEKLAKLYKQAAKDYGCFFMNAAEVTPPSKDDGVHLSADGHSKLGIKIAEKIAEIL